MSLKILIKDAMKTKTRTKIIEKKMIMTEIKMMMKNINLTIMTKTIKMTIMNGITQTTTLKNSPQPEVALN